VGSAARTDEHGAVGQCVAVGLDLPAGPRFGVDGTLERFIRLPYALPEPQLEEAVELLARAWRSITGVSSPQQPTLVV
jgi:DNA-binding transcriptional MocR family regulator